MVTVNRDKAVFYSLDPIDKIVKSGTFTVEHGGAQALTTSSIQNFPDIRTVSDTEANDYGRAGFIRAVYSIDGGTSWQPVDSVSFFGFTESFYIDGGFDSSYPLVGNRMQVAIGCDDTTIYVRAISDYFTGNTRVDLNNPYTVSVYSGWTAAAQTVLIRYWMFERE